MGKRERENPCGLCGHYHKYEEGEVCSVCGHRMPSSTEQSSIQVNQVSAFPSEILPGFLYLGSYDNASRAELLKTQGISRILNTVPSCQNLYKNSFTYHCIPNDKILQFDEANNILEQCEKEKVRVLVHCMSGRSRSPAIVIAYLMKSKGWRLTPSYQWVKERRPSVEITQAVYQQLQQYEQTLFRSVDATNPLVPGLPPGAAPSFSFGFAKSNDQAPPHPAFVSSGSTSIFSRSPLDIPPQEFTFGAGQSVTNVSLPNPNCSDIQMDSS